MRTDLENIVEWIAERTAVCICAVSSQTSECVARACILAELRIHLLPLLEAGQMMRDLASVEGWQARIEADEAHPQRVLFGLLLRIDHVWEAAKRKALGL